MKCLNEKESFKASLGFRPNEGTVNVTGSIMLRDITLVLEKVPNERATREAYESAIVDRDCLGISDKHRHRLAHRFLSELYGLDPAIPLFVAFRYFWNRDVEGRPLLSLMLTFIRDKYLRESFRVLRDLEEFGFGRSSFDVDLLRGYFGEDDSWRHDETLDGEEPSPIWEYLSLIWSETGHSQDSPDSESPIATPETAAFAIYLSIAAGFRGNALFETDYIRLMDCPLEDTVELVGEAVRRELVPLEFLSAS